MSQYNGFGPEQPRYKPLNPLPTGDQPAGRPEDWPSPTADPYAPPSQGNWGSYQPGAPLPPYMGGQPNPSSPLNGQPQGQPYNYSNYNGYGNAPYNYNNYSGPYNYIPRPPTPPMPLDPQQLAAQRVNAKMRFYKQLRWYIILNVFFWLMAMPGLLFGHAFFWPIFLTVFWGMGLYSEYRRLFGQNDQQRRQMIDEELRRINSQNNHRNYQ